MIFSKNKKQDQKYATGYTIVETVIYIALFALMSVVIIDSLLATTRSFKETRTNRDMIETGTTVMERITREIRGANSIDAANSTYDANPGVLSLNTTDSSGTAKTVKFDVSSSALRLTENSTVTGNLTSSTMSVTNVIFRKITTSQGTAIKIELTVQDSRNSTRSEKFYDTAILRGAY